MAKVLDDLTTRFMSFSDALESQFGDLSIDFSLPSKTLKGGLSRAGGDAASAAAAAAAAAGDARALSAAAEEREAAKKRGEEILQQLPPGYFESSFDALQHELRQMEPDAKQDDIDVVVDRLTSAMEVVSMRLAKHVLKNQDKLIAGITSVTHVEDDVKAAYVVCRGSRAQLRSAADEVQCQIKIITSTRKKQASMEVLDVLSRVKKVKDLPAALRTAHEEADHAEAILLCVDCFHAVDTLSNCKIASALQVAVQRAYYDAMQHLNTALMNVCADFNGDSYSRLLEAYLLQGVPPEALAEKVLTCYSELLRDVSTRLVRSMVLARAFAQQSEAADSPRSSAGGAAAQEGVLHLEECSFVDLCRRVAPDILQPCLIKLLESVYDLLASYHTMLAWHEAGLADHTQAAAAAAAGAASASARSPEHSQGGSPPAAAAVAASKEGSSAGAADAAPSQEQLDQVQAATKGILSGVHAALQDSRMATAEAAAILVKELLAGAGGCTGSDFAQVVGSILRFAALAESFAGSALPTRDALLHILGAFVRGSHKSSLQTLKQALAAETWAAAAPAAAAGGSVAAGQTCDCVQQSLSGAAYKLPSFGADGFVSDFAEVLLSGNPFRKQGRTAGGRSVITATGNKVAAPAGATTSTAATASSSSSNSSAAPAAPRDVSSSCLLVLQWLCDYAGLMVPLPSQQQLLWGGIAELFDNYLLACFVLFSGVSLQTLVWQDDCLPNRLRSALLRITTGNNCKYKAEVEELQRTKPAPASLDVVSSIMSGGGTGSSKLDMFTRKFKDTMVELINADLSQPLNDSHSAATMALTPRQQQQQPGSRSTNPSTPRQQQQQQQQALQQASPQPQQQQQQPQSQPPSGADASSSSATAALGIASDGSSSSIEPQQPGAHATFLRQCVVAINSLTLLADALKGGKPALLQLLKGAGSSGGAGVSKEVEGYFSRTVDAAVDLRDAIYLGAAKRLLPGLADAEYGLASAIADCNYNMTEPATRYQPWVAEVLQQYAAFGKFVAASALAADVQHKFWDAALRLGAEAMLDGLGQVTRCSQQGRAAMSLDLSAVEKGLRPLAPPSSLSSLRRVDTYIKAFYIPWEEVSRWAQTHLAEYGKARIVVLVECMADAYSIKRGQRAALMDSIRTHLAEFA